MRVRARRPSRRSTANDDTAKITPRPVHPVSALGGSVDRARQLGHRVDRLSGSPSGATIQRTFAPRGLPATDRGNYLVGRGGAVLYSKRTAPGPVPSGLYTRRNEQSTTGGLYYEWTPNVRFLADSEADKEDLDVGAVTRAVERPAGKSGDVLPKLGVVGKNDCANFATALQALILDSGEVRSSGRRVERIESLREERDEIAVAVGDMMKHYFPGGRCNYHAATIVAKDSSDVVTLEGHVSKDLQAPEFHVRNGLAGFVRDNRQDTDKVDVEPAEANKQVGEVFSLYRALQDPETEKIKKLLILNNALAATKTVKGQIRRAPSPWALLVWLFVAAIIVFLILQIFKALR